MNVLLGLLSLAGLGLFLGRFLRRSSALGPLLAVGLCMLWFTLLGCAGLLVAAGWAWYALCTLALVWVLVKEKKKTLALLSPGFCFFVLGGLALAVLFWLSKPLFIEWDDFTFWGTAAKTVYQNGALYTQVPGNLLATSYPPGLIVYSYMLQFFGTGFTEYGMMAGYSFLCLAAFSAAASFWQENKAAATAFLCGLFLLPFFFEPGTVLGQPSWAYLSVMADLPLALLFGGALAFYFTGGEKDWRLLLPFGLLLAALTNIKDIGLALSLIALMIVAADLLFCERERLSFGRLKGWKGWLVFCLVAGALVGGMYLLWAGQLALSPAGVDRFNLGSAGESLGMGAMLLTGVQALFGLVQHAQFSQILPLMLRALVDTPVSVLGSGLRVFLLISLILLLAWLFAATKRHRRRVQVFYISSTLGFALFYLFHIFLYAFIFKPVEALILKDYVRYIGVYWQGWLLLALVLLGLSAFTGRELRLRVQAARAASLALSLCLLLAVALRNNPEANFLFTGPSRYGVRLDVQRVLAEARAQGMQPGDTVYLLSQGDDSDRSYKFRYEMDAKLALQYAGALSEEEQARAEKTAAEPAAPGQTLYRGNIGGTIVPEGPSPGASQPYPAVGDAEDLAAFLQQEGITHFLIDRVDNYFLEEFGGLFSDGLAGWSDDDSLATGHRYYRVSQQDGELLLVPEERGAAV